MSNTIIERLQEIKKNIEHENSEEALDLIQMLIYELENSSYLDIDED